VALALAVLLLMGRLPVTQPLVLLVAAALLAASVFAAVHHAEVLALRLGEPFGSLLLAVAVTVIEVALIVSLMLSSSAASSAYARDTVYSAVMIVLNGVIGLCLVLGGARHHEQTFRPEGAGAALGVLFTLATITLILPNYTVAAPGPLYATSQLVFVGLVALVLYSVFVFVQTVRHRDYFLPVDQVASAGIDQHHAMPTVRASQVSLVFLCVALIAVVLLAKLLSSPLKAVVIGAGLPETFVGVVIAAVVLLPEALAAVAAARVNRLQTSLNLALGSAIASIGLTIPAVAVVSIWTGKDLALGIAPSSTVLLALTMLIGAITLATGSTTVLQGAIHLVIFGVFIFLAAVP
jgi:Ca2+:H+ antiporter